MTTSIKADLVWMKSILRKAPSSRTRTLIQQNISALEMDKQRTLVDLRAARKVSRRNARKFPHIKRGTMDGLRIDKAYNTWMGSGQLPLDRALEFYHESRSKENIYSHICSDNTSHICNNNKNISTIL